MLFRKIVFFERHFLDFYQYLDGKAQLKIEYILDLIRFERMVPKKFLKSLKSTQGLYEIRVVVKNKSIRILCFFDDGNLVVLLNAFVKKTKKTPSGEIMQAQELRKKYLEMKMRSQ